MGERGVVAAGHAATAEAAAQILRDGGNAFDAAIGAMLAACVAEPVLCSLGGGGFVLARPEGARPKLFDFFVQTPRRRLPEGVIDIRPVVADFGTTTQNFHCGLGTIAVPGMVRGLFAVHESLGHMPLADIAAPALRLARDGVVLSRFQVYVAGVVAPILTSGEDSRALFCKPDGRLPGEGEVMRNRDFADALDALVHEGADLFHRGEIGRTLAETCEAGGGLLRLDDLEAYRVEMREPLTVQYGDATLYTNPPPASGGTLVAFGLEMLRGQPRQGWGTEGQRRRLARIIAATAAARAQVEAAGAEASLLDPRLLERWRAEVAERPPAHRGTTHVSVVDAAGNAASVSVSNGETSGVVIPGTGIVCNNMLGESDLCPEGWQRLPRDTRMTSMMAPTLVLHRDGAETALGSGGSSRIRSAVLQVLENLLDHGMALEEAVTAPRLHAEDGLLSAEHDVPEALRAEWPRVQVWPDHNMFFGGVHAVRRSARGAFEGIGDPRRDGAARVVV